MVTSNQITPGMTLEIKKQLFRVESVVKVTVPKGAPFIKTKLRDLTLNKVLEKNFKLNQQVSDVTLKEHDLEFLYLEGKNFLFLDINTLEQIYVPLHIVGDKTDYLKEGTHVIGQFYGDMPSAVDLPQFMELMVARTEGGENAGPLSNVNKVAILETGAKVEVPLFIEDGDIIKVDTKSAEYIQRV